MSTRAELSARTSGQCILASQPDARTGSFMCVIANGGWASSGRDSGEPR